MEKSRAPRRHTARDRRERVLAESDRTSVLLAMIAFCFATCAFLVSQAPKSTSGCKRPQLVSQLEVTLLGPDYRVFQEVASMIAPSDMTVFPSEWRAYADCLIHYGFESSDSGGSTGAATGTHDLQLHRFGSRAAFLSGCIIPERCESEAN